jgi:hypothetical protein
MCRAHDDVAIREAVEAYACYHLAGLGAFIGREPTASPSFSISRSLVPGIVLVLALGATGKVGSVVLALVCAGSPAAWRMIWNTCWVGPPRV